jgi:putative membrane protein
MRLQILAILLAVLPASPALAQIGNPGFFAPDTRFESPGVPAPNQTNSDDRLFAQLLAEGGTAEVVFGELASQKAQAPAAGDFARRMIDDHSAANKDLQAIAEKSKIPLPDDLNADHVKMRSELEALDGAAFDLAYMRGQVVDHQKATQLLIWQIANGQDGELQRFASKTLPKVLEHLSMARAIVDELTSTKVARSEPAPAQ